MGAYREAARTAWSAGLNPIPLWASGKPMEEWAPFQEARIDHAQVEEWCRSRRHYRANLGSTLGGPTGLCVVDVDDPDFIDAALDRFGWTPAQVATPSGGRHLYFANPGNIATRNARRFTGADAMPLDILGNRGFVKLPPSQRKGTDGYRWHVGDWEALSGLPEPNPGSIPEKALEAPGRPPGGSTRPPETVLDGERGEALFRHLLAFAERAPSLEALQAEALAYNARLPEPLTEKEALGRCAMPWRYRQEGRLHPPGKRADRIAAPRTAITDLATQHPEALALLLLLQHHHQARREVFAISPKAMAPEMGWGEARLRKARAKLVALGYLQPVNAGGAFHGDAAAFRFGF